MKPINPNILLGKAIKLYAGTASGEIVPIMAVPISEIAKIIEASAPTKIGRPHVTIDQIPETFLNLYPKLQNKEISVSEFARACGLSRPTVYKYIRLLEEERER